MKQNTDSKNLINNDQLTEQIENLTQKNLYLEKKWDEFLESSLGNIYVL